MNQSYWNNFYNTLHPPTAPSSFAEYTSTLLSKEQSILDVGCGNGRDTHYFEQQGYTSTGFDLINIKNFLGSSFIQGDVEKSLPYSDVYYCRFFIHTLHETVLDKFLNNIRSTSPNCTLFIETRSTKGITDNDKAETNFKSPIGKEHFRMLYSMKYLYDKLEQNFYVSYIHESNDFSVYKDETPYLIRVVATPK